MIMIHDQMFVEVRRFGQYPLDMMSRLVGTRHGLFLLIDHTKDARTPFPKFDMMNHQKSGVDHR